jgi:hypothetical protein
MPSFSSQTLSSMTATEAPAVSTTRKRLCFSNITVVISSAALDVPPRFSSSLVIGA